MSDDTPPPACPGLLEEMTVEEVRAFDPEVVVLPLGSTEPHGPHLPMGTDVYQVTRLCRLAVAAANANTARALLYPTLPITNNANFRAFPFALRIGIRTLMSVTTGCPSTECSKSSVRARPSAKRKRASPGQPSSGRMTATPRPSSYPASTSRNRWLSPPRRSACPS